MSDAVRASSAQARGLRWHEARRTNYVEQQVGIGAYDETERPAYVTVWEESSPEAAADMQTEANAAWGPAINVTGYDRLSMIVDHIAGTATTAVRIGVQVSYSNGGSIEWFDLYADESGTGTLSRKVYDWATAVDGKIAFDIPQTEGRFMRFKVWVDGATKTGSRAVLRARRMMNSL